jgi:3-oxoacyl-(acyl-carrier-protein) synthase
MRNRVAITGCGVVCALGDSLCELSKALRRGESGVRLIASDPVGPAYAAACPNSPEVDGMLSATERALFDPVTRYAMRAAYQALDQSRLSTEPQLLRNTGVYVGTALGGMYTIEEAYRDIWYHGAPPKPLSIVCAMHNAPAAHLSIRFGLQGPNYTFSVACASSAIAIGEAFTAIRSGRLACALAGGTEACVTAGMLKAWQAMRVLAVVDRNSPEEACRPFSRNRTGMVLGEGAALFVLEPLEVARERGAPVLCELLGFGVSTDASHICIPEAEGQAAAMTAALADAGLQPRDIDYLNAHGTATRTGDLCETRAIRQAFGAHAGKLAISSTKAAHGHLLGGAGALELAVCIAALNEGFIPATVNLQEPDPECDLDFVPGEPRTSASLRHVMSNSFAFGGSNAVLIARRAD